MEQIFFNSVGRLRSGWRFLIFMVLFLGFGTVFGVAARAIMISSRSEFRSGTVAYLIVNSGVSLVLALILGWLCARFLEGLPYKALGSAFSKYWFKNLILGSVIGVGTVVIAILIAIVGGGLSLSLNGEPAAAILKTLAVSFTVFAIAAAFEEAFFRGYILQTFSRAGLAWLAIALTSLAFAAAHLDNPSANWISTVNTAIAGIWFGVAYLKTRDLWFAFGLHFMWNWVQGSIFGVEVSGLKDIMKAPLLKETDSGPGWLTGGDYGIEASIACTVALVLSTLLIQFAPFLKVSEEMMEMTGRENPAKTIENV